MLAELDNEHNQPEFSGLSVDQPIESIELLVLAILEPFGKAFKAKAHNEKYLNSKLINLLNRANSPFIFEKDVAKKNSNRSEDVGVYLKDTSQIDDTPIYVLEAKRLPTPTSTERLDCEYVMGKKEDGGIERFKKELHGESLSRCGMIGYIEEDDFDAWLKKINSWIALLIEKNDPLISWLEADKLELIKKEKTTSLYKSANSIKKTKREVLLTHFWVVLT